ncbi:MAG: hypothetical protein AAF152_03315 [Cyanobacteria bacterium P01_A01_bin.114]
MTSNFDDIDGHLRSTASDASPPPCESAELLLDVMMRDRFELLSAYLDGEVTPYERRQVARWLSEDSRAQVLYHRLLSLRQAMRSVPIESAEVTSTFVADIAFQAVCKRIKIASLAIACTASAVILSSTHGVLKPLLPAFRWGVSQSATSYGSESLEIILSEPVIELHGAEKAVDLNPDVRTDL